MDSRPTADTTARFAGPAYAIALLFIVLPVLDTLAQVWPVNLGSPGWRYGAVGLGANYLVSMLFGMLGLAAIAGWGSHRRTLKLLAVVFVAAGLIMLVGVIGFLLDALQLRPGIPKDDARTLQMFDVGVAKATLKYLLSAPVALWLAVAAWRGARAIPRSAPDEAPKLVGGDRA